MNPTIKPLTPELATEFFDFFDNRAFSDRKRAFCYCTWFHFDCSIEEHYKHGKNAMRSQASDYIANGRLNGYLAFVDDVAIGWCNADDKTNFMRLKADPFISEDDKQRVKAIVCFSISPDFRGKGVAAALLQRVIEDAKAEGYFALESYPKLHDKHEQYDYAGPIHLYEKTGFVKVKEQEQNVVMRKELG